MAEVGGDCGGVHHVRDLMVLDDVFRVEPLMAKPDAQTVAQMAATIASGLAEQRYLDYVLPDGRRGVVVEAVELARAIVAEVERAELEEQEVNSTRSGR
jgi:hypothetical protein